ncbi:hypothetical protein Tco_1550927 [Tanacetum coccineum]
MSVLKECIGDNPNLLFISDRHAAIALAVQNEFPLAYHVVCCRHLLMNISLKGDKKKALFWKICKAYTTEDFPRSMSHLQDIQPDVYDKLCQLGPQRWSRAHCPLVRYNYLISNSVESVNACTVVYRKLPLLKLAETHCAMVQEWYYKRRKLADNMTYEITDWAANKERIEITKRSKNDQKPTRNESDKSKSEESAKDHSRISPTQQERQSKTQDKVKRANYDKYSKIQGLIWKFEVSRTKFAKRGKCVLKKKERKKTTRTEFVNSQTLFITRKGRAKGQGPKVHISKHSNKQNPLLS